MNPIPPQFPDVTVHSVTGIVFLARSPIIARLPTIHQGGARRFVVCLPSLFPVAALAAASPAWGKKWATGERSREPALGRAASLCMLGLEVTYAPAVRLIGRSPRWEAQALRVPRLDRVVLLQAGKVSVAKA
jgi:hypothetical protein